MAIAVIALPPSEPYEIVSTAAELDPVVKLGRVRSKASSSS